MIENYEKLSPVIKIKNFPSRERVVKDFKSFLLERKSRERYKIVNKSNKILLYVNSPNIAYKFAERYNNKILANPLYSNSQCSLIFNKPKNNNSLLNSTRLYSNIKPKLYLPVKSLTEEKPLIRSASVISDYERRHWANIKDKACIIENDSPYLDNISKEYIEKKNNEKKWVNKQNFNVFVGKASSINNHDKNEIKNYVFRTPSLPPILYQFRKPQKKKWVGKADFHLY